MKFREAILKRFNRAKIKTVGNESFIFIPYPINMWYGYGENKKKFKRKRQFNNYKM